MAGLAAEEHQRDPGDPAYAYLLQIEAFGVAEPGPEASAADLARYHAARRGRTFHQLPEAVEVCTAWVADIHGRLWSARKFRDGDAIEERHTPASAPAPGPAVFTGPLLTVARATGILAWGLDPTPEEEQVFSAAARKGKAGG